jgi:hypothetical protein
LQDLPIINPISFSLILSFQLAYTKQYCNREKIASLAAAAWREPFA